MPKINVYLPDELADAVRDSGVPISSVCQRALEAAVREVRTGGLTAPTVQSLERFTDRARTVVRLATTAARAENVDVGSEHVLLGLIKEGTGVGARALEALGITADFVREAALTRASTADGSDVYSASLKEALKLGHNYVGTEHLLLGIAATNCTALQILGTLGVQSSALRHQVVSILTSPAPTPPAASDVNAKLDEVLRRLDALEERLSP